MLNFSEWYSSEFRFRRALFVLLLAVALVGGCGPAFAVEASKISGKIVDAAGSPVAGAQVYVFASANTKRPADYMSNRTAADGVYEVKAPAGKYWLVAMARKSGAAFGPLGLEDRHSGEPVVVELKDSGLAGQDFTVVGLREAARQHQKENADLVKVRGVIVDTEGKPVENAAVLADPVGHPGGVPQYVSAWSDAEGRFFLYVPRGKLFLGATRNFPPPGGDIVLPEEYRFNADRADLRVTIGRD